MQLSEKALMPPICAKCQLVRPEGASVPVWQCPGCGVAYNKATEAARPHLYQHQGQHARTVSGDGGFAWGKWLLVLALIVGCYAGYQAASKRGLTSESVSSFTSRLGRNDGPEQLAALAAETQAGDIFVFSADWCPNCREAKGWMDQHGFKYEQCDIEGTTAARHAWPAWEATAFLI